MLPKGLLTFLKDGGHAAISARMLTHSASPVLARMDTTLYRADWDHAENGSPHILNVQAAAHSVSPLSLATVA